MAGGWNIDNPLRDEDGVIDEDNPLNVTSEESLDLMATNNVLLDAIKNNTANQVLLLEELKIQTKYLRKIYNPE